MTPDITLAPAVRRLAYLGRARSLVAAGPYDARPAEVAAVHALLYPQRDPVCQTCPRELGPAFFAIKRWVEQQGAASDPASISSPAMKKTATARFASDSTIYTPHGLGVAYSNANLTDKAARDILAADPDAKRLFDVLPPDAEDESAADTEPAGQAQAEPSVPGLSDADLDKLADRVAARLATGFKAPAPEAPSTQPVGIDGEPVAPGADPEHPTVHVDGEDEGEPVLTVSTTQVEPAHVEVTTGQVEAEPDDTDRPVRLSRMNKEQLLAAYRAEVQAEGGLLVVDAHNDDLREAIAQARAAKGAA